MDSQTEKQKLWPLMQSHPPTRRVFPRLHEAAIKEAGVRDSAATGVLWEVQGSVMDKTVNWTGSRITQGTNL